MGIVCYSMLLVTGELQLLKLVGTELNKSIIIKMPGREVILFFKLIDQNLLFGLDVIILPMPDFYVSGIEIIFGFCFCGVRLFHLFPLLNAEKQGIAILRPLQ